MLRKLSSVVSARICKSERRSGASASVPAALLPILVLAAGLLLAAVQADAAPTPANPGRTPINIPLGTDALVTINTLFNNPGAGARFTGWTGDVRGEWYETFRIHETVKHNFQVKSATIRDLTRLDDIPGCPIETDITLKMENDAGETASADVKLQSDCGTSLDPPAITGVNRSGGNSRLIQMWFDTRLGQAPRDQLHASVTAGPDAFTVRVDGERRRVTSVQAWWNSDRVDLLMFKGMAEGQRVTVAYDRPDRGDTQRNWLESRHTDATKRRAVRSFVREFTHTAGGVAITSVAVVSTPSADTDRNGTPETYVAGDTIAVEVAFAAPVRIAGGGAMKLRLLLGEDGAASGTKRLLTARNENVVGGTRLRFEYTVVATDTDTDGVYIQAFDNGGVLNPTNTATSVRSVSTGEIASSHYGGGLPTGGDPLHKVAGTGPPGKPDAPAVSRFGGTLLKVAWTAPSGTGIAGYDVRYAAGTPNPGGRARWIEPGDAGGHEHRGTATEAVVAGVERGEPYRVQVRAVNADGVAGPWSASGSVDAFEASTGNRAPRTLTKRSGTLTMGANACQVVTNLVSRLPAPGNTLIDVGSKLLADLSDRRTDGWPAACTWNGEGTALPLFDDQDGDALLYTLDYTLPANVVAMDGTPRVATQALWIDAIAARATTDVSVVVTATDPDGASASATVIFEVGSSGGASAPAFTGTVADRSAVVNRAMAPLRLPVATGGDPSSFGYTYAVSGLPAGLAFDAATRTVHGTPTATGTFAVEYTAHDADTSVGDGDRAHLSFTLTVTDNAPRIVAVVISSTPKVDADGDGTPDTYGAGETITADVIFSEPVKFTGGKGNVRLRLDVGADDGNLANSRKVLSLASVHGNVLRFGYSVIASDTDADGVWVQTASATDKKVVFLVGGATVTSTDGSRTAVLTRSGLSTTGDANHKVNGGQTDNRAPALVEALAQSSSVFLTFDEDIFSLIPTHTSFTVNVNGTSRSVDQVSPYEKRHAIVYVSPAIRTGDTVTISYTKPSSRPFRDVAGNQTASFNATAVNTLETAPPELVAGTIRGSADGGHAGGRTRAVLHFNERMDHRAPHPGPGQFELGYFDYYGEFQPFTTSRVTAVTVANETIELQSTAWVSLNMQLGVRITDTANIRGLGGTVMAAPDGAFRLVNLTRPDPGAPALAAADPALVDGDVLTLNFDRALDPLGRPPLTAFALGAAASVESYQVRGQSVVLTLDRAVAGTETGLTVSYTKPGSGAALRNQWGTPVASFAGQAVRNAREDTTKPLVVSGTVDGATVTLRFSEALDETVAPAAGQFDGSGGYIGPISVIGSPTVSGATVTLTLSRGIVADEKVWVTVASMENIRDLAGNEAVLPPGGTVNLTNLATSAAPGRPALAAADAAVVNRNELRLAFDKDLDPASVPPAGAFRVSSPANVWWDDTRVHERPEEWGSRPPERVEHAVDAVAIDGRSVVLTLRNTMPAGHTGMTVGYDGASLPPLQNPQGQAALGFADQPVTVAGTDTAAPAAVRAEAAGNALRVLFDEALDESTAPAGNVFTVVAWGSDGERREIAGTGTAAISGPVVTVTLAEAVKEDDSAKLSYARGATPLRDAAGNEVADIVWPNDLNVAVRDITPPRLVSGTVSGATVRLHFSEALDEAVAPVAGQFTPQGGGTLATVTGSPTVSGVTVTLTLSRKISASEVIRVRFKTMTNIRDLAGNEAMLPPGQTLDLTNAEAAAPGAPALAAKTGEVDPAVVHGAYLTLTFDQALDPSSLPPAEAFSLGYTVDSVAMPSEDATKVVLRIDPPALPCSVIETVSYSTALAPQLRNPWGEWDHETTAFFNRPVTNARADECDAEWYESGRQGSVIVRSKRPFARTAPPQAAWFTVAASNGPVTVTGAAFSEDDPYELTLEVSRDFLPGETVTVSYHRPMGALGLWSADGYQLADMVDMPVAIAAAGEAPALSVADAQAPEGGTLGFAVRLSAAADSTVTVSYATTDGTALAGEDYTATAGTLSFAAGETEKIVEVRVLTDDAAEDDEVLTLTLQDAVGASIADGEAVGTLANARPPLTASFHGLPAEHDARTAFSFELRFSENFPGRLDYEVLRDAALQVDNGRVIGAARTAPNQNRHWTITVRPWSTADVTVSLSASVDCAAAAAICTPDGRALSNSPSATVPGPGEDRPAPNAPAAGVPILTGTVQVGETLTASTDEITDADGLTGSTFAYQWLSNDAPIAGATGSAYTLTDADVGAAVKVRVAFTDDAGHAETLTSAAAGPVAPRPNRPATGAPTIAGTAQVGETLTASTADIADADGLTHATFAYQWLSNDAAIAGATDPAYTLAGADAGRTVKVQVTFTDDAGHPETLTSRATQPVSLPPVTASFHGLPSEHDGARLFSFELRFSENFPGRLDYMQLRDRAFQVVNGRVRDARRVEPGQNLRWTIAVRPASFEDVVVTLPAGAVSTEDGRALANTVSATVRGPAVLSVADAQAHEGEDTAVEFVVTLSRAASRTVTVDYATRDGTATAGEDYTATRGTLTFAVGETSKAVSVPILDDAIDEGKETFTLKLMNAQGAAIGDDEATGTIENSDLMPKAWTARFGRAAATHVVDALEQRLNGTAQAHVQLGGHRLGTALDADELTSLLSPHRSLWEEVESDGIPQDMTLRDLILGSSFHLVSEAEGPAAGARVSAWGRVATSRFDGLEDQVSLNGTVTTATLGVDGAWKRWVTGLLLAYSEGDGAFTHVAMPGGDLESSLTSVHPYVAYTLSDRVRLWGMVGYGSGALRLRLEDQRAMDTDLSMTMGALGLRGSLLNPSRPGGLELALRADALWTVMDSAKADNLAATEADASRLRLVLEGSRPVALAGGGSFTPSLELGLRHDGGDAETGTGVEVGGRLRYASAWGLSIEASVRGLLAHEAQDYTEWGASGALRFDPGRQGRGLTAAIVPTWGPAASGISRLWDQTGTVRLVGDNPLATDAAGRLEAELGYGLATLQGRGLLTPYARVALTEGAHQAWHLGTRLALAESLNLSLEASRRARQGQSTAHELALRANLGF